MTGEYGYLTADGVYRTTVYTSSPYGGYVVLAQTKEERGSEHFTGMQEGREKKKEFDFNYTVKDSPVTNKGHHHEVRIVQPNIYYQPSSLLSQGTGYSDTSQAGSYWWDAADGYRRVVTYTADSTGYHPVITKVKL